MLDKQRALEVPLRVEQGCNRLALQPEIRGVEVATFCVTCGMAQASRINPEMSCAVNADLAQGVAVCVRLPCTDTSPVSDIYVTLNGGRPGGICSKRQQL
jgi:hypothetical protein